MRGVKGQAGKSLVPLLGVLAALAMGVAAVAIYLQMQEREKRFAKERALQLALAENDDLKARMEEVQQARAKVEEDLARTRKDLTQSQEELAKATKAQEALSRTVEDREHEIGDLRKHVEEARTESQQTAKQVSQLEAERNALKQQLADFERAKGELEAKLAEHSQPTVELEKVLVTGDQAAAAGASSPSPAPMSPSQPSRSPLDGQVVVINREYDFIVMNLGKNQGLSVGQEFQVVRDNQVLGKVKVEKVYDELSAAAILPDSQKNNIREGDAVRAL